MQMIINPIIYRNGYQLQIVILAVVSRRPLNPTPQGGRRYPAGLEVKKATIPARSQGLDVVRLGVWWLGGVYCGQDSFVAHMTRAAYAALVMCGVDSAITSLCAAIFSWCVAGDSTAAAPVHRTVRSGSGAGRSLWQPGTKSSRLPPSSRRRRSGCRCGRRGSARR